MKKFSLVIILFMTVFYFYTPSCQAMHIISARELSTFDTNKLWSSVASVRTVGQGNEYIRFNLQVPSDYNGIVRGSLLVSGENSDVSFNFIPGGTIKIFEFKASDPDMIFWIIKDNSNTDEGLTHDLYLIGPYKEGYITYVNMDSIVTMGWNSVNMKVRQLESEEGAWPILQGFSNNGDGLVLNENLVLSWDDDAGWFQMLSYPLTSQVQKNIPNE